MIISLKYAQPGHDQLFDVLMLHDSSSESCDDGHFIASTLLWVDIVKRYGPAFVMKRAPTTPGESHRTNGFSEVQADCVSQERQASLWR